MDLKEQYKADIDFILSRRDQFGADFWTTDDHRIGKGSPLSARDVAIILTELGFTEKDSLVQGLASTIFKNRKSDGQFKISPRGAVYPCHTITALRVLCSLGFTQDERLQTTFDHLFNIQHDDGGWRCNTVKIGKSLDTDFSNPGVTLEALDAFRHTTYLNTDQRLDQAVDFLLLHWELKRPIGPCHFGIGSRFMRTEFPFFRYNLFYYCHTLSFYDRAVKDKRFLEALSALEQKLVDGQLIIENPNRRLGRLSFCKKGKPNELATKRYNEMIARCS